MDEFGRYDIRSETQSGVTNPRGRYWVDSGFIRFGAETHLPRIRMEPNTLACRSGTLVIDGIYGRIKKEGLDLHLFTILMCLGPD
jgi:hypothetical protein